MHEYVGIFLYIGWSVYLILVAAGMQKGKKLLFWMLVALLGANFVVPTWTFCAAFFILATGSV